MHFENFDSIKRLVTEFILVWMFSSCRNYTTSSS